LKEPRASIELEKALVDVNEENFAKFSLKDVVLPLVGHKTRFPQNEEMKQIILDLLKKDGITLEMFE